MIVSDNDKDTVLHLEVIVFTNDILNGIYNISNGCERSWDE